MRNGQSAMAGAFEFFHLDVVAIVLICHIVDVFRQGAAMRVWFALCCK